MDQYLRPESSLIRLMNEYELHKSLVIAFDFDNTVYDFHGAGYTYSDVIKLLIDLKEIGCYLICFTANEDRDFIAKYLEAKGIPVDAINVNPPFFKGTAGKIYFNALLDDRAGLEQVYNELTILVNRVKSNKPVERFYRVCHIDTKQGLWYDQHGQFTGLIHGEYDFCENSALKMDFDPELCGYLSATNSLESLFHWFPEKDILRLQEHDYFIHVYECSDSKFYLPFHHLVINQSKSKLLKIIKL